MFSYRAKISFHGHVSQQKPIDYYLSRDRQKLSQSLKPESARALAAQSIEFRSSPVMKVRSRYMKLGANVKECFPFLSRISIEILAGRYRSYIPLSQNYL